MVPPKIQEVKIYFCQKGIPEKEAEAFCIFYEGKEWKNKKGAPLRNWRRAAWLWGKDFFQANPWFFNRKIH